MFLPLFFSVRTHLWGNTHLCFCHRSFVSLGGLRPVRGDCTVCWKSDYWRCVHKAPLLLDARDSQIGPLAANCCDFACDGHCSFQPYWPDVYESVRLGECPMGLVPQENSIHGIVTETYDILRVPDFGRDVFVRGEVTTNIQHCLITRKGVGLGDVTRILSHEQVRTNSDSVSTTIFSYHN